MKELLPIKDLPAYLTSIRENVATEDSIVVDMGRIIIPSKLSWVKRLSFAAIMCLILGTSGWRYYSSTVLAKNIIVVADGDADLKSISKMASEYGGGVVYIKRNKDSTYEIKLTTNKNTNLFIKWLKERKEVIRINSWTE